MKRDGQHIDILLFVVCLLATNYFWKYTVNGDEGTNVVLWLGRDITAPFEWLSRHVAGVCFWLTDAVVKGLEMFRSVEKGLRFEGPYTIVFPTGFAYSVVWSCTGLKQSFIWLIIMLFARGPWLRKLWFIPLGWLCIYVFNIFRITLIGLLCMNHPTMFDFYHTMLFKYLFYAMLFGLWVWWTECLSRSKSEKEDS